MYGERLVKEHPQAPQGMKRSGMNEERSGGVAAIDTPH